MPTPSIGTGLTAMALGAPGLTAIARLDDTCKGTEARDRIHSETQILRQLHDAGLMRWICNAIDTLA